jgi:hypothetical protein
MRNLRGLDKLVTLIKELQDALAVSAKTPAGKALRVAAINAVVPARPAVEPMSERRVSLAGPVGVFAFMRKLHPQKKAAGGPPHECEGQSAALLDSQALHWTQIKGP